MASVVFAVPGTLYLNPTNATTGGTALVGVEENTMLIELTGEIVKRRNGVGPNAGYRSYMRRVRSARLIIPLRDQSADALTVAFSQATTDGADMRSTGGTANLQFSTLPTFAAVVRPDSTSEKYLYSAAWALDEDSESSFQRSDLLPQHDGQTLILVANKVTGTTGPMYGWAAAATINTMFGL